MKSMLRRKPIDGCTAFRGEPLMAEWMDREIRQHEVFRELADDGLAVHHSLGGLQVILLPKGPSMQHEVRTQNYNYAS